MADDIAKYGFFAVVAFVGYKALSGFGETVTAPARFAGDTLDGLFGAGGQVFGGTIDTADNLGDWAGGIADGTGEVVNSTLAVPGDLIETGQGAVDTAVGGTTSTVDNVISGTQDTLNNLW